MSESWVRVFEGSIPAARIAEGLLQESGIPAQVVSTTPGYFDAASKGTASLTESVLVPAQHAETALELLRADRSAALDG